jgi:hypothetical protein
METHGGVTPVFVHPTPTDDDGNECDASFDRKKNEIDIGVAEESIQKQRLFHETFHRCLETIGVDLRLKVFGAKDEAVLSDREEHIICLIEGPLFDVLVRNGWLKFPKPPRFE